MCLSRPGVRVCTCLPSYAHKLLCGIDYTLNDLNAIYSSTRGGLNVSQLVSLAQTVGIRLIPSQGNTSDDINILKCPAIALLDENPLVVIAHVDDAFIDIVDPLLGRIQFSLDQINHKRISVTLEARYLQIISKREFPGEVRFLNQLKTSLSNLRPVFLIATIILILIILIFQLSSAQIQNVFFDWVLAMGYETVEHTIGICTNRYWFYCCFFCFIAVLTHCQKICSTVFRWNQYIYRRMLRLPESFFLK